jgi:hypothetical protein
MGSSSGSSSSGSNNSGGNNKTTKKKATPKATPVRARNNKQKAKKAKKIAAVVKSARDTRLSDVRIQRANLPSEVAKQYAQPARTRPATPIVSTAKAFAAPQAKINSSPMQSISATENAQIDAAKNGSVGPASTKNILGINNIAQSKTSQDPKLLGDRKSVV